jgi:diguanylate cyclase (GGDEF)-like protein
VKRRAGARRSSGFRGEYTDTVCRHGGDEFVIVLTDLADPAYLREIAAKLKRELRAPIRLQSGAVSVSCSIGMALYPRDGRDHDSLLARADASMYTAKRGTASQPLIAQDKE